MTLQQLKEAKRIESHIINCEEILNELNKNLDNNRYKFAVFSYDVGYGSSWSYFNTDEGLRLAIKSEVEGRLKELKAELKEI